MNIFDNYAASELRDDERQARDDDFERMAERKYQAEEYRGQDSGKGEIPFNSLWQDYRENWVEITEFVGVKKPMGRAMQGNLFDEVA